MRMAPIRKIITHPPLLVRPPTHLSKIPTVSQQSHIPALFPPIPCFRSFPKLSPHSRARPQPQRFPPYTHTFPAPPRFSHAATLFHIPAILPRFPRISLSLPTSPQIPHFPKIPTPRHSFFGDCIPFYFKMITPPYEIFITFSLLRSDSPLNMLDNRSC